MLQNLADKDHIPRRQRIAGEVEATEIHRPGIRTSQMMRDQRGHHIAGDIGPECRADLASNHEIATTKVDNI